MIKASVPVAKPAASKVAPAENKAAIKVLPSAQPMQLAADSEQQNFMEGVLEPDPGKIAPSSPFQFKSSSSIIPANHSPIQRKSSSTWAFQAKSVGGNANSTAPIQRAAAPANKTGLPNNVKSGVEQLSGVSLNDVNVHYNSPKPAQLQAHAYAQGTDIHVASGQEKHVPHEAWHVVQQKQGRVKANKQLKGAVPINDDAGLEMEADVMGAKAVAQGKMISNISKPNIAISSAVAQRSVIQFLFGFGEKKQNSDTNVADQGKKTDKDNKAEVGGDNALGVGENMTGDSLTQTPTDGSPSESEGKKGAKITNNYTKSGFITEKASLRKTDVVNTIIETNKKDKTKAAKVIKSGVLPKDDGWFGLGLLGVKTENFELPDNFDPKKIGYLIPVKIDSSNEDSEIGWSPVMINYQFNEESKLKLKDYKNEEGYIDSKKIIKSELDLNAKGTALTGKDNALGAAMNGSIVGKVVDFAINNSKTVRGMANEAVGGALDVVNKGAEFIQNNAINKVKILNGLSFGLDKAASKITPNGSFITGKVSKDKWIFSSTFKVNTNGDYSAEYMGSVIENPPELELGNEDVAFKLNFGSMVKHQADPNAQSIKSENGEASFAIMGQKVFAKWNTLDFNLTDYKVTEAQFSQVGVNLNLSVGNIIKVANLAAAINDLSIADNKMTHGDIDVSIDSVNLLDVATFSNIKGSFGQKTGFSGEGDFNVISEGLGGAKGKVSVTKGPDDKEAQYKLQDGEFDASIMGQRIEVKGVNYDSLNPNEITAASSNLTMNFSVGDAIKVESLNVVVSNIKLAQGSGFTYENISVNIPLVNLFNVATFSNISGNVSAKGGFEGQGDFSVTAPELASGKGKVSVKKAPEDAVTHYNLQNGSFEASVLGQKVAINGVAYDSSIPKTIAAASSNLKLNFSVGDVLKVDDLDATLTDAMLTEDGFTYSNISVNINSVDVLGVAKFNNIIGDINVKNGFSGSGDFEVTLPGLSASAGKVSVTKGPDGSEAQYKLENGAFNVGILGQAAAISGVDYDSISKVFTIKKGNLNLNIFGTNLNIEIINPSYTKENGFNFASASATVPELVFADQAKMSNILVNVVKNGNEYTYDGASDFNLNGQIGGANASAKGNVSISKVGQGAAELKFTNADVSLSIFGQRLELKGVNYAQGEFQAEQAKAYINTPFMSESEIAIENLKINGAGYTFSRSEFNPQMEVDFGFLKANLASLAFEKTGDSWIVSGEGGLSAGGSKFLGYSLPSISGSGILSYDFGAKKTEKELKEVSVTLPGIEFPKAIGLPNEMGVSTEIPVLPGLNVVAKAGIRGNVTIPGLKLSLNKKADQVYQISAGTPDGTKATGEFFVFIAAGVGTGIPLIASVSVTLGAEGGISVGLSFNVSKDIGLDSAGNIDLNSESMKTEYQLSGDLSLAAFIELTGSAFFFSKSFRKELAKTSLGSFEKSNDQDFKWIKREEPLQGENETLGDIKKNLKVDLTSAESKIWTAEEFKTASKKWYEISDSSRVRIVAVDESLKAYDAIRDQGIDSDIKVKALNKLKVFIEKYLADTKGTSSRTESVETLWSQIQEALQELEKIPSKLLE